ncbi:MAG: hypothetical protein LBQ47_07250 [Endomicrobium sp.]|nr:hypothetical protein [Endomicrobium sp.]
MKQFISLAAVFTGLMLFGAAAVADNAQPQLYLKPGEALIKKANKKTALNVLTIDYSPQASGILKIEVYDSNDILIAAQKEKVNKINDIATAVIYVAGPLHTENITAVLNGAGFENKHIQYVEN